MQHPDEGHLMALLDGELSTAEIRETERHLAGCAACTTQLAELRQLMGEADGLVVALGEPEPPAREPAPVAPRRGRGYFSSPPLAWAAGIIAVVGLGFAATGILSNRHPGTELSISTQDRPAESPEANAPVMAPQVAGPGQETERAGGQPGRLRADGVAGNQAAADERELASRPAPTAPPAEVVMESDQLRDASGMESQANGGRRAVRDSAADFAAKARQGQSLTAERPAAASVEARREQAAPASTFQRATMEEAVASLSGAIRLVDGLTPEEFEVGAPDGRTPVVRVTYRVGATETPLVLEQSRALSVPPAAGVAAAGSAAQPNSLSWNDLQGFSIRLSGRISKDSLNLFKTRVK